MKLRMYFGAVKTALISVAGIAGAAIVILDAVMLSGVSPSLSVNTAVAGVSLAAAIIVVIAAILILFNSTYVFSEDAMIVTLGFFADRLEYEKITAIRQNTLTKEIWLSFSDEHDEEQSVRINVSAAKTEDFLAAMRKYRPFIIAEYFTPDDKKKKK